MSFSTAVSNAMGYGAHNKSAKAAAGEEASMFEGSNMMIGNHLAYMPVPRSILPADLVKGAFTNEAQEINIRFMHGTTTLGMVFQGGIVLAVDSRASMGKYISSQTVKKAIPITPFIMGTMAGGAADCQFWERHLGRMCRLHELRNKERISVTAASRLLANILHSYKGMGLSMGTMVAGWDKTGPNLFYVDSDGLRVKNHLFSVGSGSPYAYGVLDTGYRHDLTVEEAIDLARRSIYHATYRDVSSGGFVSVFHIKETGWEMISRDDVQDLYERYHKEGVCTAAEGPNIAS